jgi:hypothetical protein
MRSKQPATQAFDPRNDPHAHGDQMHPFFLHWVPGLLCWLLTILSQLGDGLPKFLDILIGFLFSPLLLLALGSSLFSFVLYARQRRQSKPWYVHVNIAINFVGFLLVLLVSGLLP